jgi:hypothetical protein
MICLSRLVYAQEYNDNNSFNKNNEWDNSIFDLRLVDIPQIGMFYCFNDKNMVCRISIPIAIPVFIITPVYVTYASSYWGISGLLGDVTFTFIPDKWNFFGNEIQGFTFSNSILFRVLPIEIWVGIPLSSKGMGIYILFEIIPFNIFNFLNEDYKKMHNGYGLNTGIKYILSKHIEFEIKYENYISYVNKNIWKNYLGITFKYRLFEPGYYGVK